MGAVSKSVGAKVGDKEASRSCDDGVSRVLLFMEGKVPPVEGVKVICLRVLSLQCRRHRVRKQLASLRVKKVFWET